MTTNPKQKLAALKAKAEAATPGPWSSHYDKIFAPSEKGGVFNVADVRGWGYFTGNGHGALALHSDEARRRQDANAAFIAACDPQTILDLISRVEASPAIPSGEQWRDIASAPKNTKILVGYFNGSGKWRTITAGYYTRDVLEAHQDSDDEFAPEDWYEESETHDDLLPCETPTHWQPLPAPPGSAPIPSLETPEERR